MKYSKKANVVGIGIIAMALLLLLGSIFIEDTPNKKEYLDSKNPSKYSNYSEDYLFYLEEMDIGRQRKTTQSFPNIILGSKTQYDLIYLGNTFRLNANPFTNSNYSFNVKVENHQNSKELLIYFDTSIRSGNEEIIIYKDNKEITRIDSENPNLPIRINEIDKNVSQITFELKKPKWFDIFNWNKIDIKNLKTVEVKQNKNNNIREFNFEADEQYLDRLYIDLAIKCDEIKEISEAIKIEINGYIVSNENPRCLSRNTVITANIPLNILNKDKNILKLETEGLYSLAYSINKISFNDKQKYKFTINSFNDIIDVVMYGDFDREIMDIEINNKRISLERNEIKSIIQYLKFGTNEIEFLNKPIEIKEFIIEKSDYWY